MIFVTMKIIMKFLYNKRLIFFPINSLILMKRLLLIQFSLAIVTHGHLASNTNNNHVFIAHRHVDGAVVPADLGEVGQRPDMIQVAAQHKLPQPTTNPQESEENCQYIKRKRGKGKIVYLQRTNA